jgi:hypothetical protein
MTDTQRQLITAAIDAIDHQDRDSAKRLARATSNAAQGQIRVDTDAAAAVLEGQGNDAYAFPVARLCLTNLLAIYNEPGR